MNITQLLRSEMIQIATNRVNKTYDAPTFTFSEEQAMLRSSQGYQQLENQALDLYKRIAILSEYQSMKIQIDNAVQQLREYHAMHRKSRALKLFWKYYIPLSKEVHKSLHEDCARYSYLCAMNEIDHQFTLGVGFKPDAAFVKEFESSNSRINPLAKGVSSRSRVDRYLDQQLNRDAREDYEVRDGILVSQYQLLMGE